MPIVEPEVLMDGDNDIDRCFEVTEWVLKTQFEELYYQRVALEGIVLKPNMAISGKKCAKRASVEEVAEKTVKMLKNCVPGAVPGIAFLSGGQSDEEATAHLDAMNKIGNLPWRLTFSYGRALQHAPQKAWSGKSENVAAAQRVFSHRARMNGLASMGQWKQDLESAGGLIPLAAGIFSSLGSPACRTSPGVIMSGRCRTRVLRACAFALASLGAGRHAARRYLSDTSRSPSCRCSRPAPASTSPCGSTPSKLSESLGKPVVVENRPGSAGLIGDRGAQGRARRRLHPDGGDQRGDGDPPDAAQAGALRSAEGLRADRALREVALHPGGRSEAADPFGSRADQVHQGTARPAQLQLIRRRRRAAPVDRSS